MGINGKVASVALVLALAGYAAITLAHAAKEKKKMIDKSTPILHVKTVEPSVKFWTERFGFKTTIQVPEGNHIGFAAIESGSIELMYQTYEGMKGDASNPLAKAADQGPSFIFMEVPDINAVVKALDGAEIVQGRHDTPYGAKEVVAKEPGGHFVIFSQLAR
jgi:catechol 2,3-dioxygenase-like lactoylglutathione lyase family enzyme